MVVVGYFDSTEITEWRSLILQGEGTDSTFTFVPDKLLPGYGLQFLESFLRLGYTNKIRTAELAGLHDIFSHCKGCEKVSIVNVIIGKCYYGYHLLRGKAWLIGPCMGS